jgi:translocator protein
MSPTITNPIIAQGESSRIKAWHGVVFFIAMHILSAPWLQTPAYLDAQVKAPFAPPDWAFAPIWFINTVLMTWAGMLLLRKPENAQNRSGLITMQVVSWICFITFGWFYFGLHSPMLGAAITITMLIVNAISVTKGFALDKRFSYALMPLLVWLVLASAVAVYQALHNPDELLGLPALMR